MKPNAVLGTITRQPGTSDASAVSPPAHVASTAAASAATSVPTAATPRRRGAMGTPIPDSRPTLGLGRTSSEHVGQTGLRP